MKVGILTYHSVYNFGANLQAYSTLSYLSQKGVDAIVIDYLPKDLEDGYNSDNPETQANAHTEFVKKNLKLTNKCRNVKDVAEEIERQNIEAVIIGSDAVLQHKLLVDRMYLTKKGVKFLPKRTNLIHPNPFWGCFSDLLKKKIPIIVMSGSSQNMNYKLVFGKTKRDIGDSLFKFNKIFVRDDWTKKMVAHFTKQKIIPKITPDPVFGFNQNVKNLPTKEEIITKFNLPADYALLSFKHHTVTNNKWLEQCNHELMKHGIEGVLLTMPGGIVFKNPPIRSIPPPLDPLDWYCLIRYARAYIGENMHPIIVALHNAVPFFSFDSYGIVKFKYFVNEKSSKIYHILKQANMLEYRVSAKSKKYELPKAEDVTSLVINCDITKIKEFSNKQLERYNAMMQEIINF